MIIRGQNNRHKTTRRLLALVFVVVFIVLGCFTYVYIFNGNIFGWSKNKTGIINGINYSPPTTQEINDGQTAKKNLINEKKSDANTPKDKNLVEVGISNTYKTDTDLEIRAFIPGIIEGNGQCTATLTKSAATISVKSDAFIDSTSSICRPILIPLSQFSEKGTWKLVVQYSSDKYYGASPSIEVEV